MATFSAPDDKEFFPRQCKKSGTLVMTLPVCYQNVIPFAFALNGAARCWEEIRCEGKANSSADKMQSRDSPPLFLVLQER